MTVSAAGERSSSGHAPYRSASRPGSIAVTLRWFRLDAGVLTLIVFCAVWHLLTAGLFAVVAWTPSVVVLVRLPFVAFGAAITYVLAAVLLNRTTIRIADGELAVRHGPFPWPGSRTIPTALLCGVLVSRDPAASPSWAVIAETTEGTTLRLLGELHGRADAEYVARIFEDALGLASTCSPIDRTRTGSAS